MFTTDALVRISKRHERYYDAMCSRLESLLAAVDQADDVPPVNGLLSRPSPWKGALNATVSVRAGTWHVSQTYRASLQSSFTDYPPRSQGSAIAREPTTRRRIAALIRNVSCATVRHNGIIGVNICWNCWPIASGVRCSRL